MTHLLRSAPWLVVLAALALGYEMLLGPGMLRGVTAMRTPWFWIACASVPVLLYVCVERLRVVRPRRS